MSRRTGIDDRIFDVVIVGGGISGASAAQHLAAAGYSVLLAEKNDFASAASSRSSRILHSGLRYLAPPRRLLDFVRKPSAFLAGVRMARLSSRLGDEFIRVMPHQVRTTRLLLPLFETSTFRGWQVDFGARFLEWIAGRKAPLNYRRTPAAEAQRLPFVKWLRTDVRLKSVAAVDDHQFVAPERLCIDSVLDAERLGAVVLNYTAATGIRRVGDEWQVALHLDGGDSAAVRGRVLLNFAGVWVDRVNALASGNKPVARKIVGVKGVSFAIELPPECEGVGIAGHNAEGDAIMCVPWGKLHYVGPTETVYHGDIDDVRPEREDLDHLIADLNAFLPGLELDRSKIIYAWAGVRPITYDPDRAKGRRMPFSVIHRLDHEGLPNMLTITWAAIMFHRHAARQIVAEVRRLIPPGGPARAMAAAQARPADDQPFMPGYPQVGRGDLVRAARDEHARDLVGILFRRTALGWNVDLPPAKVREAAILVAGELGWDDAEIERQVEAYDDYVQRQHLPAHGGWQA